MSGCVGKGRSALFFPRAYKAVKTALRLILSNERYFDSRLIIKKKQVYFCIEIYIGRETLVSVRSVPQVTTTRILRKTRIRKFCWPFFGFFN